MPKIDDDHYERGRNAFTNGVSLRAVMEPIVSGNGAGSPDSDGKEISFVLGFFDAAVDRLRGIAR